MGNSLQLLHYHCWSINRLLEHVKALSPELFVTETVSVFPSIRATIEHLYWADLTWFNRIRGINDKSQIPFPTVDEAQAAFLNLHHEIEEWLQTNHLNRKITYQNSSGTTYENSIEEIITHLVNHGSYHKGNVTAMIRSLGYTSISTDYIVFLREKSE